MAESNVFRGGAIVLEPKIKTLAVYPVKDSWVDSKRPLWNFGKYESLRISNHSDSNGMAYFGFDGIDFDALGIEKDNLVSAKFVLTVTNTDNVEPNTNVELSKLNDLGWEEESITYAGNHNSMTSMSTVTISGNTDYEQIEFDISSDVRQQFDSYKSPFGFTTTTTGQMSMDSVDSGLEVYSRESEVAKPVLMIRYYDYSYDGIGQNISFSFEPKIADITEDIAFEFETEELERNNLPNIIDFDIDVAQRLANFIDLSYGRATKTDDNEIDFEVTPMVPVDVHHELDIAFEFEVKINQFHEIAFEFITKVPVPQKTIDYEIRVERATTPLEIDFSCRAKRETKKKSYVFFAC